MSLTATLPGCRGQLGVPGPGRSLSPPGGGGGAADSHSGGGSPGTVTVYY